MAEAELNDAKKATFGSSINGGGCLPPPTPPYQDRE